MERITRCEENIDSYKKMREDFVTGRELTAEGKAVLVDLESNLRKEVARLDRLIGMEKMAITVDVRHSSWSKFILGLPFGIQDVYLSIIASGR